MEKRMTHVDSHGMPTMVDVGNKAATERCASAEACLLFPPGILPQDGTSELQSAKGPVFATAIVAGTMAVKRTHELIPFCHSLVIDGIAFALRICGNAVVIACEVKCQGKTGVEMEAMTGASVAALTVYDMCKALTHGIVIENVRLVQKSGGKTNYEH